MLELIISAKSLDHTPSKTSEKGRTGQFSGVIPRLVFWSVKLFQNRQRKLEMEAQKLDGVLALRFVLFTIILALRTKLSYMFFYTFQFHEPRLDSGHA